MNAHYGLKWQNKPESRSWYCMMRRCYHKKDPAYDRYGGAGIEVCERWRDPENGFANFLADMGPRPEKHTLDRINSKGNYCPENCRWADWKTQERNKDCVPTFLWKGAMRSVAEIAEMEGKSRMLMKDRILKLGWSIEDALNTPQLRFYTERNEKRRAQAHGNTDS